MDLHKVSEAPKDDSLVIAYKFYDYSDIDPEVVVCWYIHGEYRPYTDGLTSEAPIHIDTEFTHWHYLADQPWLACVSCGDVTDIECDIKDFDPDMHYCGKDPRCCP